MVQNLSIGCILIIVTTVIHSITSRKIIHFVKIHAGGKKKYILPKRSLITVVVVIMIFASFAESVIWASAYLLLHVFESFEEAVYFSLVTYTTLGFGEITLNADFRWLAALEAANGIIIFGWSTAVVMAIVQRLYFKSSENTS